MKWLLSIKLFFLKYKPNRPSLFSKALTEGISDMFREMGYPEKKKMEG